MRNMRENLLVYKIFYISTEICLSGKYLPIRKQTERPDIMSGRSLFLGAYIIFYGINAVQT